MYSNKMNLRSSLGMGLLLFSLANQAVAEPKRTPEPLKNFASVESDANEEGAETKINYTFKSELIDERVYFRIEYFDQRFSGTLFGVEIHGAWVVVKEDTLEALGVETGSVTVPKKLEPGDVRISVSRIENDISRVELPLAKFKITQKFTYDSEQRVLVGTITVGK